MQLSENQNILRWLWFVLLIVKFETLYWIATAYRLAMTSLRRRKPVAIQLKNK